MKELDSYAQEIANDHDCGERKASTQKLSTLQQSLVSLWVPRHFSFTSFRQTHVERSPISFILLWYTFYSGYECLRLATTYTGFGNYETS
jgi:hypothetical protein